VKEEEVDEDDEALKKAIEESELVELTYRLWRPRDRPRAVDGAAARVVTTGMASGARVGVDVHGPLHAGAAGGACYAAACAGGRTDTMSLIIANFFFHSSYVVICLNMKLCQ
jgi:hypothetical protein